MSCTLFQDCIFADSALVVEHAEQGTEAVYVLPDNWTIGRGAFDPNVLRATHVWYA